MTTENKWNESAAERLARDVAHDMDKYMFPPELVKSYRVGGQDIRYATWSHVRGMVNMLTGGAWHWQINDTQVINDRAIVVGTLTIPCKDVDLVRQAIGEEKYRSGNFDAMLAAERNAYKRAVSWFVSSLANLHADTSYVQNGAQHAPRQPEAPKPQPQAANAVSGQPAASKPQSDGWEDCGNKGQPQCHGRKQSRYEVCFGCKHYNDTGEILERRGKSQPKPAASQVHEDEDLIDMEWGAA